MRTEIERDLDAIGEKLEKFVEYASWGGQGQLVEIETQIPEKLANFQKVYFSKVLKTQDFDFSVP